MPEVLKEIRDKQARQALASQPVEGRRLDLASLASEALDVSDAKIVCQNEYHVRQLRRQEGGEGKQKEKRRKQLVHGEDRLSQWCFTYNRKVPEAEREFFMDEKGLCTTLMH